MARTSALHLGQDAASRGERLPARITEPASSPESRSIAIESVHPEIDGGAFSAKGCAGEPVRVEADIFKEGHGRIRADVLYRLAGEKTWSAAPMREITNDRWAGVWTPERNAPYEFSIEAWSDPLATWLHDAEKRAHAGAVTRNDLVEGMELWREASARNGGARFGDAARVIERIERADAPKLLAIVRDPSVRALAHALPFKVRPVFYKVLPLFADRPRAVWSAWYELFPRSQAPSGAEAGRSGTFRDVIARLEDIRKMGFNVLYLPPIHPIGRTNRKGPGNTLNAPEGAPGSPWAIGSEEGGHKAIHPELGTIDDFEALVREAGKAGIEIALDFAIQVSPDHPYVKEHPEWFARLPDGSIRYAENPPKKYEDIYPVDFYPPNREELWTELKTIVDYWIGKGVRIFRVDNPHTKPFEFWRWLIDGVRAAHPDVIFLSEAFTRPKVMKRLAKCGFTQSYTYFTWRNTKRELVEYVEELEAERHVMRANFFVNTPDILHAALQTGGKPAFKSRLVLAATLARNYGIYSGFELIENEPKGPGSEEYAASEKYEIKPRDWSAPGNIKDFIARVNRIREHSPALRKRENFRFLPTRGEHLLAYAAWTNDLTDVVICVVNLDPHAAHDDTVTLPLAEWKIEPWQTYQAKDLLTEEKYYWKGAENYVRLDPFREPAHILRLRK